MKQATTGRTEKFARVFDLLHQAAVQEGAETGAKRSKVRDISPDTANLLIARAIFSFRRPPAAHDQPAAAPAAPIGLTAQPAK